jgi:hypothetical protein
MSYSAIYEAELLKGWWGGGGPTTLSLSCTSPLLSLPPPTPPTLPLRHFYLHGFHCHLRRNNRLCHHQGHHRCRTHEHSPPATHRLDSALQRHHRRSTNFQLLGGKCSAANVTEARTTNCIDMVLNDI